MPTESVALLPDWAINQFLPLSIETCLNDTGVRFRIYLYVSPSIPVTCWLDPRNRHKALFRGLTYRLQREGKSIMQTWISLNPQEI